MGDLVDDLRAALVMNPNFCRLRYKKEESTPKKNGFCNTKEDRDGYKNSEVDRSLNVEDRNGNVCIQTKLSSSDENFGVQTKDSNSSTRKVSFKEEDSRSSLRRRASDMEVRDMKNYNSRRQNCRKCTVNVAGLKNSCDRAKKNRSEESLKNRIEEEVDLMLGPSKDPIEVMELDEDSKDLSSDPSRDSLTSDHGLLATSPSWKRTFDLESSSSSLQQPTKDVISLEDILAQYSSVLDSSSLQLMQKPSEPVTTRKKRCTYLFIFAFIIVPTLSFYSLLFLYFVQPEPLYTSVLKNLKLKEEPKLASLATVIDFIRQRSSELLDYIYEKLETT